MLCVKMQISSLSADTELQKERMSLDNLPLQMEYFLDAFVNNRRFSTRFQSEILVYAKLDWNKKVSNANKR